MGSKFKVRIALVAVLAVISWILWKNKNSTGGAGLNDFKLSTAITKKVDKILISPNNKTQTYIILTKRTDNSWWVKNNNTELETDTQYVNRILNWMLPRLQVKAPVGDKALEKVNRDINLYGKKVMLYEGDKVIHTFFVGGGTSDGYATYMHLPGAERPSIVEIPGFAGTLDFYFTNNIMEWRSSKLFSYKLADISKLEVKWAADNKDNFSISHTKNGPIFSAANISEKDISNNTMLTYLNMYESVYRETGNMAGINRDSVARNAVLAKGWFFEVQIFNTRGVPKKVRLYYKPLSAETYAITERVGSLKEYETDSYFAQVDNNTELFVVQDIVFKKLMKKASDFVIK